MWLVWFISTFLKRTVFVSLFCDLDICRDYYVLVSNFANFGLSCWVLAGWAFEWEVWSNEVGGIGGGR